MPFAIGETVGSYRVIEPLGQGGMANVFKAYHAALDRYVAIKVLHLALNDDQNVIARFRREARVVARLDHANIVPVYDFAEYEGQAYLVMKYIEGETLKARLLRGAIGHDDILPVVEAVGAALTYAHQMGVLHRDVKPSNVLLTNSGQIYLADFGLAKMIDRDEASLTADRLEGTPLYISPEQALAKTDLDGRTDEYSFGVMAYEMVVGRVPFNADTPLGTIHDHVYKPVPPPRQVAPDISDSMETVLLKVLAKDRNERFTNVAAFVRAFRAAFTGQPVIPEGSVIVQSSEDEQLVFVPPDADDGEPIVPPSSSQISAPVSNALADPLKDQESLPPTFASSSPLPQTAPLPPLPSPDRSAPQAVSQQASKSSYLKRLLIGCAIVFGAAFLLFLVLLVRGTIFRNLQKTTTPELTPTLATVITLPPPAIRQDLDAALASWKIQDLASAMRQLTKTHLDIAGDSAAFNEALQYLENQNAWLLAAAFVYTTDRPKLLESITSQIELIHEILYKAAIDPQASEFMQRNAGKPLFEVAFIRYEVYFGDLEKAAGELAKVLDNRIQQQRFPEARLLQAELSFKQNNLTQASAQFGALTTDTTLPDWVHNLALELDQKIKTK